MSDEIHPEVPRNIVIVKPSFKGWNLMLSGKDFRKKCGLRTKTGFFLAPRPIISSINSLKYEIFREIYSYSLPSQIGRVSTKEALDLLSERLVGFLDRKENVRRLLFKHREKLRKSLLSVNDASISSTWGYLHPGETIPPPSFRIALSNCLTKVVSDEMLLDLLSFSLKISNISPEDNAVIKGVLTTYLERVSELCLSTTSLLKNGGDKLSPVYLKSTVNKFLILMSLNVTNRQDMKIVYESTLISLKENDWEGARNNLAELLSVVQKAS